VVIMRAASWVVLLGRWRQRDCHAVSLVARRGRHIGRTAPLFPVLRNGARLVLSAEAQRR